MACYQNTHALLTAFILASQISESIRGLIDSHIRRNARNCKERVEIFAWELLCESSPGGPVQILASMDFIIRHIIWHAFPIARGNDEEPMLR